MTSMPTTAFPELDHDAVRAQLAAAWAEYIADATDADRAVTSKLLREIQPPDAPADPTRDRVKLMVLRTRMGRRSRGMPEAPDPRDTVVECRRCGGSSGMIVRDGLPFPGAAHPCQGCNPRAYHRWQIGHLACKIPHCGRCREADAKAGYKAESSKKGWMG